MYVLIPVIVCECASDRMPCHIYVTRVWIFVSLRTSVLVYTPEIVYEYKTTTHTITVTHSFSDTHAVTYKLQHSQPPTPAHIMTYHTKMELF